MVDDGQIIVLGGLIQDSFTDGTEQGPAGSATCPVLGQLFRYDNRARAIKTNLMVFLGRPSCASRDGASADRRPLRLPASASSSRHGARTNGSSGLIRTEPRLPPQVTKPPPPGADTGRTITAAAQ